MKIETEAVKALRIEAEKAPDGTWNVFVWCSNTDDADRCAIKVAGPLMGVQSSRIGQELGDMIDALRLS